MNNRGSIFDVVLIVIVVFLFAVGGLLGLYVLTEFNDKLETVADGKYNNTQALNTSKDVADVFNVMDNSFPLLFIGANLAVLFLSFMVKSHPFFLIFMILMLAGMVFIAAIFSNTYYELSHSTHLATANAELDIINFIMQNLVPLQLIFAFIDVIVMYSFGGRQ